jgi:hypothetical protein
METKKKTRVCAVVFFCNQEAESTVINYVADAKCENIVVEKQLTEKIFGVIEHHFVFGD